MSPFIHLRVHSDYSLGYGAAKIPDLVKQCAKMGMPAVCLSDRYNLFGSLEFAKAAVKSGIQPIAGTILKVAYGQGNTNMGDLLLIAQNAQGYANLLKLSSNSYLNVESGTEPHITLTELCANLSGIIVLCGTLNSPLGRYFANERYEEARELLQRLQEAAPGNLYIELIRRGVPQEEALEEFLLDLAHECNLPIVATNEVCFLDASMHEAHDILLCIAGGRYVLEDERPRSCSENYLKGTMAMTKLFADLPEAIANTTEIARRISFMPEGRAPELPRFTDQSIDETEELRRQSEEGLARHLQKIPPQEHPAYYARLRYEIEVIASMKFPGYFLIVSDFIKWSKRQGIPVGPGRGSGAGSVVAWSLEITDLDPIKFGLLFERFLNPERVSMPDFDIDFCQERRGEVINYVRNKYGHNRVANIITFGKLQARAVLRDVGRVLQMHYGEIDRICKMVPNNPANPVTLAQAINLDKDLQALRDSDENIAKLLAISLQLEGMNRHASTHAAGIVIADRPLVELVPLYKDPNGDMVLQYSMKMAEEAGLVKFDFLGLKTLTLISATCKLVKQRGIILDIQNIPLDDQKTYSMLSEGYTWGVFQFESAGMREAIKKLRPDQIGDLLALGSLYRPGPMDNIPSYINRKHGLEKPDYIHPKLENVLRETYGIIVYQEQVIEIAQVLSGYTLGGADLLRRAMGKKIKAEMEAQRAHFVEGAVKNGITQSQAVEIFNLVEKFASYGFNKSHAAAYAIISYQTAYLKAHYPVEFLVASINLEIDDSDKINLFCQEAKRMGIKVLPPDINYSHAYCSIEDGKIRIGLGVVKNVGVKAVTEIVNERSKNGFFTDIFNLLERCGDGVINKRMLENFAKAGVLANIHQNRRQAWEHAEMLIRYGQMVKRDRDSNQQSLFSMFEDGSHSDRPALASAIDWDNRAAATAEFESLGFYLSAHPLERYATRLRKLKIMDAIAIEQHASEKAFKTTVVGVITARKIRSSNRGKYAFIQLSDMSGLLEVSVFSEEVLYKHDNMLQVGKTVYLEVEVRRDNNGMRVIVEKVNDMEEMLRAAPACYHIYITDNVALPELHKRFGKEGVLIKLFARIDRGEVAFATTQHLRMSEEDLESLRSINGLEIKEAA